MKSKKKPVVENIFDSHLEVRTKTEITKGYVLTLTTLVRVTSRYTDLPRSLEQRTDEEEIYRIGTQNTEKATETHNEMVEVLTHLHSHNLLTITLLH